MSLFDEVKNIVTDRLTTVTKEHETAMKLVTSMATDPSHRERILETVSMNECEYILYDGTHLAELDCLNDTTFYECLNMIMDDIQRHYGSGFEYPNDYLDCYPRYDISIKLDWSAVIEDNK